MLANPADVAAARWNSAMGRYTHQVEMAPMALSIAAEPIPLHVDMHGTVRVRGTRLTLETVIQTFNTGASPQDIVAAFPDLELADVYAVITYYLRHRSDVDAYIQRQETKAEVARHKIEGLQGDQRGLRERLLARRAER